MSIKIKIGRKTKQGYTRTVEYADSVDCYSYALSALLATEFLRISKARSTGIEMGFCISALRQILFARIKRGERACKRLSLGTLFWGNKSTLSADVVGHKDFKTALGDMDELIAIWGSHMVD